MRRLLYVLLLAPLLFVPLRRVNIADLLPVEAVAVYTVGEEVILETDTEHTGSGENVEQALEDLKKNTPAVIYLDTAKYLLVSEGAVDWIEGLRPHLKSSVKVCVCDAQGQVKKTVEHIEIHRKLPKLKDWKNK